MNSHSDVCGDTSYRAKGKLWHWNYHWGHYFQCLFFSCVCLLLSYLHHLENYMPNYFDLSHKRSMVVDIFNATNITERNKKERLVSSLNFTCKNWSSMLMWDFFSTAIHMHMKQLLRFFNSNYSLQFQLPPKSKNCEND